jgi:hypothetical protein
MILSPLSPTIQDKDFSFVISVKKPGRYTTRDAVAQTEHHATTAPSNLEVAKLHHANQISVCRAR